MKTKYLLRDDALVDNGAAAPKPCLSHAEMGTRTVAGGLFPVGTASTARIIFYQPPLWFCLIEEINSRTSNQYVSTYSSFGKLKVAETKARQTLVFDPGGSKGYLRTCPFWERGTRCVVRRLSFGCLLVLKTGTVLADAWFGTPSAEREDKRFVRIAVDRCFPPMSG